MKKKTTITTEKHEVWVIRQETNEPVLQNTDGMSTPDQSLMITDERKPDEKQLNNSD